MRNWSDVIQDLFIWVIMTASTVGAIIVVAKLAEALVLGKCSIW